MLFKLYVLQSSSKAKDFLLSRALLSMKQGKWSNSRFTSDILMLSNNYVKLLIEQCPFYFPATIPVELYVGVPACHLIITKYFLSTKEIKYCLLITKSLQIRLVFSCYVKPNMRVHETKRILGYFCEWNWVQILYHSLLDRCGQSFLIISTKYEPWLNSFWAEVSCFWQTKLYSSHPSCPTTSIHNFWDWSCVNFFTCFS